MKLIISGLILYILQTIGVHSVDPLDVTFLSHNQKYESTPKPSQSILGFKGQELKVYCHTARDKSVLNIFNTLTLQIDIDNDDFTQYAGANEEMVQKAHEDHKSIFSFNIMSSKKRILQLDPFNKSCVGVETSSFYTVHLQIIRLDLWRIIYMAVGLFVFFTAASLSQNPLFYYLSGILLGIFASFLVVIYFISKLIPKKPLMYGVLASGWTLGIYFAQMMYENMRPLFVTHQLYVFWYTVITGFISFIICYRMGPPKNKRSKDLIRWSLQIAGLLFVFFSSYFQEATLGIIIIAILAYYFPIKYLYRVRSYYRTRFPPKPRLLSSEEYYEQGVRETAKALEELKNYCNSPECNQWKTVLKLKDVSRFASFIEGESHIGDDEMMEYEVTNAGIELSDDESDIEEEDRFGNHLNADRPTSSRFTPTRSLRGATPLANLRTTPSRQSTPVRQESARNGNHRATRIPKRISNGASTSTAATNGNNSYRTRQNGAARINEYEFSDDD